MSYPDGFWMTRETWPYVALAVTVGGLAATTLATLGAALAVAILTTNLALVAAQKLWGDTTDA